MMTPAPAERTSERKRDRGEEEEERLLKERAMYESRLSHPCLIVVVVWVDDRNTGTGESPLKSPSAVMLELCPSVKL